MGSAVDKKLEQAELRSPLFLAATVGAFYLGISALALLAFSRWIWSLEPTFAGGIETGDKMVWLAVLLTAYLISATRLQPRLVNTLIRRPRRLEFAALASLLLLSISAGSSAPIAGLEGVLWSGFGLKTLVFALGILGILYLGVFGSRHSRVNNLAKGVTTVISVWILFHGLCSLAIPAWIVDPIHSSYVMNDLLAPLARNFPIATYVPQYSAGLGYPLLLFEKLLNLIGVEPSQVSFVQSLIYVEILKGISFSLLAITSLLVSPRDWRLPGLALAVGLALTKGTDETSPFGQISVSLSAVPVRVLPVLLLGLLIILIPRQAGIIGRLGLGAVAGTTIWLNFEFGLVASIAFFLTHQVWTQSGPAKLRGALLFALGYATSNGLMLLVTSFLALERPAFESFFLFPLAFGANGFGAVPMPILGAHIFILMIAGAGLAVGKFALTRESSRAGGYPRTTERSAIASVYFSWVILGGFGYFVGRSIHSVQLQILLFFVGLVLVAIAAILWEQKSADVVEDSAFDFRLRFSRAEQKIISLPLFWALSVSLAAGLMLPSSSASLNLIHHAWAEKGATSFTERVTPGFIDFQSSSSTLAGTRVVIDFGNYYEYFYGVQSASRISVPSESIRLGQDFYELTCSSITETSTRISFWGEDNIMLGRDC